MQTALSTLFFVPILSLSLVNAFHVSTLKKNVLPVALGRHPFTVLQGMIVPDSGGDLFDPSDGDAFDVEAVRRNLESLVGGGGDDGERARQDTPPPPQPIMYKPEPGSYSEYSPSKDKISLPKAPLLTSIGRERREVEIELLRQLKNGDDVLSGIWTLWFNERGEKAASLLLKAEELTGEGPQGWQQAEDLLKDLIDTHGVYWVEPVNRLATLYYMQGKLKESEELCKTVLAVKPWHFGALSGIVMVYAAMHAVEEARYWAARRLPTYAPVGPNRRREQWVEKAVEDAQESLLAAERMLQDVFGNKDDHVVNKRKFELFEDEEDAWQ